MSSVPPAPVLMAGLVMLLAVLSGCIDAGAPPAPDEGTGTETDGGEGGSADGPGGSDDPGSGDSGGTSDPGNGTDTQTGSGNATAGNGTSGNATGNETGNGTLPEHTWPNLSQATVRPGTKIFVDRPSGASDGYCTTNFVFRSKTNGTIYIGTAAHCMNQDVGSKVYLPPDTTYVTGARGDYLGKVVYSSYKELGVVEDPNGAHTEINDFALIEVDPSMVDKVHPAMRHYGGPTALAKPSDIRAFDKVIYFGDSTLRPGPAEADRHEGYVRTVGAPWQFTAYTVVHGIPGDSGSGVLLGDGRAAGINVFLAVAPVPGESGSTILYTAMQFAAERGWDVELQTWDLLDDGILP